jgi:chromosome segregation ATPase
MDPDLKKDILDVRNVIERSTSKVSLRDLEKKGFRKVKVLRAGDINQLIYKAVQTVLAKQPAGMASDERDRILAEAKAEYESQQKQLQELQQQQDKVEEEKAATEARAQQIEQAHKNLERKLAEVNAQLAAERGKMLEEKKQLERDKQSIVEKGFDAVSKTQAQVADLQSKLADAEARLKTAVSEEQYTKLHAEAKERVQKLNQQVDDLERKLRTADHDSKDSEARVEKMRGRIAELEDELERKSSKSATAESSAELQELKAQLASEQERTQDALKAIMTLIGDTQKAPVVAAAAASPDLEKQLKGLQAGIMQQLQKMGGAKMYEGEASAADLGALMARNAETTPLETNIKDVNVKQQAAQGVRDKLSKLRSLRGGDKK